MSNDGEGSVPTPSESTPGEGGQPPEGSTGSPTLTSPPDGQGTSTLEEPIEVVPVTPEFQHPLLKGKSVEDVERIFSTQQDTIASVTKEANQYHERLQRQESAPAPATLAEPEEPYGDDFMAPRFKTLEARLGKQLEQMVAPIKTAAIKSENAGIRDGLRAKFKHFNVLEPHIDNLLRQQDIVPATATELQLTHIYHTALGVANEQGINLETAAPAPTPTPTEGPPMTLPQHRPSSAPIPDPPKAAKRELDENERRLAQEFFPHEVNAEAAFDKYRAMQDAQEDEIVSPGFSKELW